MKMECEALVVEPARRPQQTTVHETAVAPEVGARKQKELRAVVAGPGRSGGHANATTT
jgi:cysteine synthase